MNCRHAETVISAYVDRELTGDEALAVQHHVSTCPACALEVEAVRKVKAQLASLKPAPVPTGLDESLSRYVFGAGSVRAHKFALAGLVAAVSMAATLLAVRLADKPTVPTMAVNHDVNRSLDAAADKAYLSGNDPISGGVPVITASYAGDH